MPIPSEQKLTSILKNNITDVIKCLEGKYSYEKFQGRVSEYQFADDGAPSLSLVVNFVNDAADWLDHHPRNVCVVHCSSGKGRTGTMIASLLLKIGACSSPSEALQLFANRRTTDGKAVVKNPSQLRYVGFYDQLRKGLLQFEVPNTTEEVDILKIDGRGIGDASIERNIPRIITGIRLSTAPQFRRGGGCVPWFSIDQKGKRIFYSPPMKGVKNTESVYFSLLRIIVAGDIRLDFYHKNFKTKMFSCSLHTGAFKVSVISLPKRELDIAYKDKHNKHFPPNFKLEIFLASAPDLDEVSPGNIFEIAAEIFANTFTEKSSVSLSDSVQANVLEKKDAHVEEKEMHSFISTNTSSFTSNPSSSYSSASSLSGALSRMRASTQLASVSIIGTKCARCRETLGEDDFYLEVSGLSIHWDCLQCNECGRVFGETGRDSVVLMQEAGGVGCAHCGDFKSFFPSCARCGDPVTADTDCCVSVPAATTYWHTACFACSRCAAPLLFSDEDALWRIDSNGMPICFFHPQEQPSSASSSVFFSTSVDSQGHLSSLSSPSPPMIELLHSSHIASPNRHSNSVCTDGLTETPQSQQEQLHSQQTLLHSYQTRGDTHNNHIQDQPRQQTNQPLQKQPSNDALKKSPSLKHIQHYSSQKQTPLQQALPPQQTLQRPLPPKQIPQPQLTPTPSIPSLHSIQQLERNSIGNNTVSPTTESKQSSAPDLEQCSGCKGFVKEGEDVLIVADTMWHPTCLRCAHCHVVLLPSHRVTSVNGNLYCRDDFEKLFGVSCARCHTIIEPGGPYFNTGSIQFHTDCFSCSICGQKLYDGLFFMRGEAPLCEAHKNHVPPPINSDKPVQTRMGDNTEALCHSVAALIKCAKDALVSLGEFDKKTFVTLAKQLAAISRECMGAGEDSNVWIEATKAHEDLVLFCAKELSCPPPIPVQFTCNSLNTSLAFLEQQAKVFNLKRDCN